MSFRFSDLSPAPKQQLQRASPFFDMYEFVYVNGCMYGSLCNFILLMDLL